MSRPAARGTPFRQFGSNGFGAWVVAAHAVDERLLGDHTEHAWSGSARLWMPGEAAQFTEAEAERLPDWKRGGVLVHARCQSDRVGKSQSAQVDRESRGTVEGTYCIAKDFVPAQPSEDFQSPIMNLLGILSE